MADAAATKASAAKRVSDTAVVAVTPDAGVGTGTGTGAAGSEQEESAHVYKWMVISLCLLNGLVGTLFSLFAPFLPHFALSKGVSQFGVGLIFAAFPVFLTMATPLSGALVEKRGCRSTIVTGAATMAAAVAVMGLLTEFHGNVFLAVALAMRLVQAMAAGMVEAAAFTLVSIKATNSMATVMGILETAAAVGTMVGPVVGGFLFEVQPAKRYAMGVLLLVKVSTFLTLCALQNTHAQAGGFYLPMLVLGGCVLLMVPFLFFMLPADDGNRAKQDESASWSHLLSSANMLLPLLAISVSASLHTLSLRAALRSDSLALTLCWHAMPLCLLSLAAWRF